MMQQVAVFSMVVEPRVSEELKHHWRRFVVLGAALIVLGVVALGSVGIATITSVLVFGWILVVAGILETIHAWRVRGWSGFTRHLLGGVLSFVVGGLIIANPAAGTLSLTLLMAAFFIVGGVFRIATALSFRFPGRGWALALGAVLSGLLTAGPVAAADGKKRVDRSRAKSSSHSIRTTRSGSPTGSTATRRRRARRPSARSPSTSSGTPSGRWWTIAG